MLVQLGQLKTLIKKIIKEDADNAHPLYQAVREETYRYLDFYHQQMMQREFSKVVWFVGNVAFDVVKKDKDAMKLTGGDLKTIKRDVMILAKDTVKDYLSDNGYNVVGDEIVRKQRF